MSPSLLNGTNGAKRIVVIGSSCAGKTTLARGLGELLDARHVELDAIHWLPEWKERSTDEFRTLIEKAVAEDRWVVDGNYWIARDVIWARATTVVWLNYSFGLVFWRALRRTVTRAITREELFSGNRESFFHSFFTRESILWWVLTTYRRRRRQCRELLNENGYPQLEVIELRRPREAAELLAAIGVSAET